MNLQQLRTADMLDILFDGRNKDYGAYQLRRTYNNRLYKSIAVTGSVCLLFIFVYTLAGKTDPAHASIGFVSDPILTEIQHDPKPDIPVRIPKQHIQAATIQNVIPRIVPDPQVQPQDVPPMQIEQDNAHIGTHTASGPEGDDILAPPPAPAMAPQ